MSTPNSEGLNALRPRVLHTAYHVRNIESSVAFYVGVLGMREQLRFELPDGEWECVLSFFDDAGRPSGSGVILMWHPDRETTYQMGDGYSRLILKVSDLEAAVAHLRAHDVPITVPPTKAPNNLQFAMCKDPDGYLVELLQLGASTS